jgi:hypothetical protein
VDGRPISGSRAGRIRWWLPWRAGPIGWTAILDAVRWGPSTDATAVTAAQLHAVAGRLRAAGHWRHRGSGNPGGDGWKASEVVWLGFVLADLPCTWWGGCTPAGSCSPPTPPRSTDARGERPRKHGTVMALTDPRT